MTTTNNGENFGKKQSRELVRQYVNFKILVMALSVCLFVLPAAAQENLSDEDIQKILIKKDKDVYLSTGHNCPCPDDTASDGSICGDRSAYVKRKRHALPPFPPLCYPKDVSPDKIEQYRKQIKEDK
jgi:hypothetical protein